MNESELFILNHRDFLKSFVVFVFAAVLDVLLQQISQGFGAFDYKQILLVATTSGISYLLKNLISDSNGKILGKI
jgi:hypothetical protein